MIRISKPAWVLGCFIIFVSSATLVVVVVLQNLKSPGKNGIIVPEKPPGNQGSTGLEPRNSDKESSIPSLIISTLPSYFPSLDGGNSAPTVLMQKNTGGPSILSTPMLAPAPLPTYPSSPPSLQYTTEAPSIDHKEILKPTQADELLILPLTVSPSMNPSMLPTQKPSEFFSMIPTLVPIFNHVTNSPSTLMDSSSTDPTILVATSQYPSRSISLTAIPTVAQTIKQTILPSSLETAVPSTSTVNKSSLSPLQTLPRHANPPSITPEYDMITYIPGELSILENGLLLSTGLTAKLVAQSNTPVELYGANSSLMFHEEPDFAETFAIPEDDPHNPGGWMYVSNAEVLQNQGGVGSIEFDKHGNAVKYEMLLNGTTRNCGGGKTPWNTFISCEEVSIVGLCHQVDPLGDHPPAPISMSMGGGRFESFAHDTRNLSRPRFFVSEDRKRGALRRFTPISPNWDNPWSMLHENGTLDYLLLHPNEGNVSSGSFEWVSDRRRAELNAGLYYPHSEGIDVDLKGNLFMVAKKIKQLFILDLDSGTYVNRTTQSGIFDGGPDQLQSLENDDIYYMTEEGGKDAGVHGRNKLGQFFTILESPRYSDETTGLAFSPDGFHMYVAYQHNGLLFDVTRLDGLPFNGKTLNIKYHKSKHR